MNVPNVLKLATIDFPVQTNNANGHKPTEFLI